MLPSGECFRTDRTVELPGLRLVVGQLDVMSLLGMSDKVLPSHEPLLARRTRERPLGHVDACRRGALVALQVFLAHVRLAAAALVRARGRVAQQVPRQMLLSVETLTTLSAQERFQVFMRRQVFLPRTPLGEHFAAEHTAEGTAVGRFAPFYALVELEASSAQGARKAGFTNYVSSMCYCEFT